LKSSALTCHWKQLGCQKAAFKPFTKYISSETGVLVNNDDIEEDNEAISFITEIVSLLTKRCEQA